MDNFADLNWFITVAAIITGLAQLIFLYNFFHSMLFGKKASANPWKSNTLEWTTPAGAPGHGNWPGNIPLVYRWPYDYSKPGAEDDFIPQNVPLWETRDSNTDFENQTLATISESGENVIKKDEPEGKP